LTVKGNFTTKGILKLGQFITADLPVGVEGALCFDTTKNAMQIYSSGDWRDLTVTKLGLGNTCSSDGDCDSGHCVDGYCCDFTCGGSCERCNVAGSIGICTEVASNCIGCSICSSGNCIADPTKCTGNCVQCTGSGTNYTCSANSSVCTGNCSFCNGSDTEYNCVGSNGFCSNILSSCGCSGSDTMWNCQSCSNPYPSNCGYATCSNYTCGGVGVLADSSGTASGETVYCDENNRVWTPTQSGTYTWSSAQSHCDGLTYAGYSDWVLPSCTSKTANSSCNLYQFGLDACGGYPCLPSWDSSAVVAYYRTTAEQDIDCPIVGLCAVVVYSGHGGVGILWKADGAKVRCVRGQE